MKLNQKIAALSLALGVASAAQAQTPVFITGSTAFRSQIFNGLGDMNLGVQQGKTSGANTFTFSGTVADNHSLGFSTGANGVVGKQYNVYCTFSGSVEGILALIDPGTATYDNVGSGSINNTGVDLAFSDVLQASTQAALLQAQTPLALSADAGIGGVAVQPFAIVGNATAGAKISNVTSYNVLDVYDFGGIDLTLFSGNEADAGTQVLGVGRYDLSGTRVTTELDNSDPNGINDTLKQYALVTSATVDNPPGLQSTDTTAPTGTFWEDLYTVVDSNGNQILDTAGTNGYFTGGNVGAAIDYSSANVVQDPTQTYTAPAIGYISFSDAQSKLASSTTHLLKDGNAVFTWNGQNPGTPNAWNITGVQNGTYTFWSYERLYTHPNESTAISQTFATAFIQAFQYAVAQTSPRTASLISEMNVYRNGDGGDVYHN